VLRLILFLAIAIFVAWCSTSVPLGKYTLVGHVKRIWHSEETQDLKDGVKQKANSQGAKEIVHDVEHTAAPVVNRVERGVKAGYHAATGADAGPARSP
jgi:hypothetical protein